MDDLISKAAIEWHDFLVADGNGMYHEEKVAYKRQIDTLPSAQPEQCDDPRADVYYLAEKIGIHRLYALVVELRGEPEPCEDAVSREAAIDIFDDYNVSVENGDLEAYSRDRKRLCELPSAQPKRTCLNCGRTANNGGWYVDGRTRCPIEEHYALPKDGYCHLWEKRNVTDDDYPERRTDDSISD